MNMQNSILACGFALLGTALNAQNLIHYRFDEGYSNNVINYAKGSPAPTEGTIASTMTGGAPASWAPGKYGTALAASIQIPTPVQYNYVKSGWNPGTLSGSMSFACWLKTNPATPNPSLTYLLGNGTLRAYTAAGAMLTTGWNAAGQYVTSKASVFTLAKQGWQHIALVLDGSTMLATYYWNGVAEPPIVMTGPVLATGSYLYVGTYGPLTYPSVYDLDDFIFANRAMTAAEIAGYAANSPAADGAYGSGGCGGVTLGSAGGPPTVGNFLYQLTLASGFAGSFSIGLGSNRASLGGIPLPFDLGTVIGGIGTCMVDSSLDLLSLSGGKGPGSTSVGLPVPANPAISGLTLYLHALMLGGSASVNLSNGFAVGIGQ